MIKVTIIQLKTRKDHETMGYSSSQAARHKQTRKCMTQCLQFTESYKYSQKLKIRLWLIGKQKVENTTVDSQTFHLSFSFISALRKQHYTLCSVQESLMSCRLQLNPHFTVRSSWRPLFSLSSLFPNTFDSLGCNAIRKHFS